MQHLLLILASILPVALSQTIVGYDCGGRGLNISRISLLDVGDCEIPRKVVKTDSVRVHLYQTKNYSPVEVFQCKVMVHRVITHCGFLSHSGAVSGGVFDYLEDLSREQCETLHNTGTLMMGGGILIRGVTRNETTPRYVTLAGRLNTEGDCQGAQFSDNHATYDDVVVQASLTITLISYTAKANREKNILHLNSGVNCALNRGRCIDNVGGHTFWTDIPLSTCDLHQYDLLYDGLVTRTVAEGDEGSPIYTLISNVTSFSIMGREPLQVCGYTMIRTEHTKLFILEVPSKFMDLQCRSDCNSHYKNYMLAENVDFITYVNSKIVYVERHVRTQMESLYYELVQQKCILEQKVLRNLLSIASIKPDEFAYNLMDGPGHMAVVTGEILRMVKCTPVEVTLIRDTRCYLELPVQRGNQTYFLTPKTHILIRKGTETPCDDAIPSSYRIGESWYEITPKAYKTKEPEILQPSTFKTWRYEDPGSLANAGIYTQEELSNLQERILFPMEQPSVLNILAHGASGHKVNSQGVSMDQFINEESIAKLVDSFWYRAWSKFSIFGNAVAGLIGALVILKFIKSLVDTILQGYLIHAAYGWGIRMLGALFTSVTHFLLYLANKEDTPTPTTQNDNINRGGSELMPLNNQEDDAQKSPDSQKPSTSTSSPRESNIYATIP